MTPAQLAVERDALLQGGRTLETIGTMQAAAAGGFRHEKAPRLSEHAGPVKAEAMWRFGP